VVSSPRGDAIFGKKDYQQYESRDMVNQCRPARGDRSAETVRAEDGWRSARATPISPRRSAPKHRACINAARCEGTRCWRASGELQGASSFHAMATLANKGWRPDYVLGAQAGGPSAAGSDDRALVVLAAAFLGRTRLIDNVEVML